VDVADKVLLLEMGADDYVTIPFSPRELVARLRALIRRASRSSREDVDVYVFYVFADVTVDFFKTEITRGGEKITVTPKEFKTLEFLTKNAQRVISRDELLDKVWGYENYLCTRTVDNHMLRLRQKLESDPPHPLHFLTVHGLGYSFFALGAAQRGGAIEVSIELNFAAEKTSIRQSSRDWVEFRRTVQSIRITDVKSMTRL
jgi:DNA-binding response OmpR family regulator